MLKKVTVQSNITQIENGSFDGCTSLERLEINNPHPEDCTVGEYLLQGTNSNIYVPKENLFAYLTNYFWSIHTVRIFTNDQYVYSLDDTEKDDSEQIITKQEDDSLIITYMANGGISIDNYGDSISIAHPSVHLRINTALGTTLFERKGYVMIGWNTKRMAPVSILDLAAEQRKRKI